jgi:hypothetical protein
MNAPGMPTPDELGAYIARNPGCKLGSIVAHFAPEGVDGSRGTAFYWAVREALRQCETVTSRHRKWFPRKPKADTTPAPAPVDLVEVARKCLEVKRHIGAAKHHNAVFGNKVAASINKTLDEIRTLASDYNTAMRDIERQLQALANELQLQKSEGDA